MVKFFNISGRCRPDMHYMVNPFRNFYDSIFKLIESHDYFLLHAPRQTGKTTLLHELAHRLNREGKYTAVACSLENVGYEGVGVPQANRSHCGSLFNASKYFLPASEWPPSPHEYPLSESAFFDYLTDWTAAQPKPIVLLLDEVDSLHDEALISVLRQLRNGFQNRPKGFPQSVAIVGLRDIREYKTLVRPDTKSLGSGSPFNVKTETFFLTVFSKEEVQYLLAQHGQETGQVFPVEVVDRIHELSGGQPWLTNALAREMVVKLLEGDFSRPITLDLVGIAKENLIARRDTHLDSLADKLREPRVFQVVQAIINGEMTTYNGWDDDLRYCLDLGIVRLNDRKQAVFANPIYQEIVPRVLTVDFQHAMVGDDKYYTPWYILPNGDLDMDKLFREFQAFYREHSESWLQRFDYAEAGQQLLLMAFLQRIINGGGRIEREMATGNGRSDLVIFWQNQVLPIELKLKRNEQTLSKGLFQLNRYLDKLGTSHGYLVLFELKNSDIVPWDTRLKMYDMAYEGKRITVVEL